MNTIKEQIDMLSEQICARLDDIASGGGFVEVEELNVTSNGTYEAPEGKAYNPVIVDVSGGGGSGFSDCRFMDYDGTVLYEYSASEVAALTELPENPSHDGLVAQGWNYTLQQVKDTVEAVGSCTVGQMYTAENENTKIFIHIDEGSPSNRRDFYVNLKDLSLEGPKGYTINWGDGTIESYSDAGMNTHIYDDAGDYVVEIEVTDGLFSINYVNGYDIPDYMYCNNMITRVEIGSSNGIIFEDCSFISCKNIETFVIPTTVTSIGNYIFGEDGSLIKYIIIPSTVTNIGNNAFDGCSSLQSIIIPSSVTGIGNHAFDGCSSLQSITIPSSVTSIGEYAFDECGSLQSITIPSGVTSIGEYAFYWCYSLQSITIPSSVTSIGEYAFDECYSLQSITIPSGVTSIGEWAFYECSSLQNITIPSGVKSIGSYAFSGCYSLQSITIPASVTNIGEGAFSDCYNLRSIIIPSGVFIIDGFTFSNCVKLSSIIIPSSVEQIGVQAFASCANLKSFVVPSSVLEILGGAFAFNTSIGEYHFESTTPPTLGNGVFEDMLNDCIIYVPQSENHTVLNAYKNASGWSDYASQIYEEGSIPEPKPKPDPESEPDDDDDN